MIKIVRVMEKRMDFYDRIVIEYTELTGMIGFKKSGTYQVYGSSGGTVWHDFNSGARLKTSTECYFSSASKLAERLMRQYQVPKGTWLDLDNRSMKSLLKNEINDADVFKITKVEK